MTTENTLPHGNTTAQTQNESRSSRSGKGIWVLLLVLIAVALILIGIFKRKHEAKDLATYTDANSAPTVSLVAPALGKSAQEILLPGNMQAFTLAPIYARTTGYVKTWTHDIGSHVHKGELLAIIETPELDQQLVQARADLETAKTNAGLAKITANRYQDLIGNNAVSQQDTDNAANQLRATNSQVAAAEANVRRLEELQSFERIVAPFDGVITARNLDIGQLIAANGSTTSPGAGVVSDSREIFDIAKIDHLRVFINVPQQYAPSAKNGSKASLTLPQYPGRTFQGTLVRTSNAVDPLSRTLLAEVDVNNNDGALLPGSYAEVHLHTSDPVPALIVPASALILLPDGMHIGIVDQQHHAHLARVTVGRDLGATTEIISGLDQGQEVISNPPDSLTDGEEVRVVSSRNNSMGQNK